MSGFVSNPSAPVVEQPETALAHDGFFPGVKLSDLRDAERLPQQVTDKRLTDAAVAAMLTVSVELAAWKAAQLALGFETLATVAPVGADGTVGEVEQIAGSPRLVRLYERAIGSLVAAELADTHHDISASADGKTQAEDRALASDEHRRNATHAIRDIVGETRTTVELI
jgi:hypothetical protein